MHALTMTTVGIYALDLQATPLNAPPYKVREILRTSSDELHGAGVGCNGLQLREKQEGHTHS